MIESVTKNPKAERNVKKYFSEIGQHIKRLKNGIRKKEKSAVLGRHVQFLTWL